MLPVAWRAIVSRAAPSASIPSASAIRSSCSTILGRGIGRKSNRWHRDTMVAGILWASVVASTKYAWSGGSSKVFRRALKAGAVSMWTSSMM